MTDEKIVRLGAKLYEIRDRVRWVLGDRWPEKVAQVRAMLEVRMRLAHEDELSAAAFLARPAAENGDGMWALLILATAVEMIEPSPDAAPARARSSNFPK